MMFWVKDVPSIQLTYLKDVGADSMDGLTVKISQSNLVDQFKTLSDAIYAALKFKKNGMPQIWKIAHPASMQKTQRSYFLLWTDQRLRCKLLQIAMIIDLSAIVFILETSVHGFWAFLWTFYYWLVLCRVAHFLNVD